MPLTHGMSKTPFYEVWHHMKQRCNGTSDIASSKNYRLRGIYYDVAWDKFENFYADMHEGYQPGLQLDRIDNNRGYSKENCRWATCKINNRNRRSTILIEVDGERRPLIELCEEYKFPYARAIKRYSCYQIRELGLLFFRGNLSTEKQICRPVAPCLSCGTLGGSVRPSGRPIRKTGLCNTCYARLVTRGKRKNAAGYIGLAADMEAGK